MRDNVDEERYVAAGADSLATAGSSQFSSTVTELALRLLPIAAIYSANNCLVLFVLSKIQLSSFVVWRNSSIVFNAILWTTYFKKDFHMYKGFGVIAFLIGLTLINLKQDGSWEPFTRPMWLVLGSCLLSASASILNEGVLKNERLNKFGLNLINILLYAESSCILFVALFFQTWSAKSSLRAEFQNLDSSAIMLVIVQASLGLVVSRVLYHADSVAKVMVGGAREVATLLVAPFFVTSRADWIAASAALWVAFAMFVYFVAPSTKNADA
jgi:multidrug transporter EmrE-like cation transporter